jgi:hypothetical protein
MTYLHVWVDIEKWVILRLDSGENWQLNLRTEGVSELRRIFAPKRDEVTGG